MTNFINFFDAHGNELDSVPFNSDSNAAEQIASGQEITYIPKCPPVPPF